MPDNELSPELQAALAALDAALASAGEYQSLSIGPNGRSITKHNLLDLLEYRDALMKQRPGGRSASYRTMEGRRY